MNYLRDKQNKRMKVAIIIAMIILVFVLLALTPLFSWLARLFHNVGTPAWRGKAAIEMAVDGAFRTKKSLRRENAELRIAIESKEALELELEKVRSENDTLSGLLGRSVVPQGVIVGRILSKPPAALYDTLLIDIGRKDGVVEGSLVLADGVVAIGQIAEVESGVSVVRMFSAPQMETQVNLEQSGVTSMVKGRGNGSFTLEFPRDTEIIKDEAVVHVASNRILGVVKEVEFDPRDPFQTVFVASPVNVQHLKFVEVVR